MFSKSIMSYNSDGQRYMREGSPWRCRIVALQSHCPSPPEDSSPPRECCCGLPGTKCYFQRSMCHLLTYVPKTAACSVYVLGRKLKGVTSFRATMNFGFLDVIFWTFVTHYWGHDPTIPEKSKPPKIGLSTFGFNDGIFLCFKKVPHAIWLGR